VLILEDEVLLSTLLEDLVREMGAQQVHVCRDMASAEKIAAMEAIDVAILDVNIGQDTSLRVADMLAERGVPFFFSTALGDGTTQKRHAHRPVLEKPFSDEDFKVQVMALLGAVPAEP
jgi:DNA-binding response OmpR family regulator